MSDNASPFRVAIVGAGPSGMFATMHLVKKVPGMVVDLYDANPAPFGLLRHGVAPDHLKIKSLAKGFGATLDRDEVSFFGNVAIGRDLSVQDLRSAYDAVVLAHGAPEANALNIPGEHLPGSVSAGELVSWYNCAPDSPDVPPFPLPVDHAVVVGAGNVALDVTRVLLAGKTGLEGTDVPANRRDALGEFGARGVTILCRRPVTAARFTLAELLEIEHIDGVRPIVDPADLELGDDEREQVDRAPQLAQVIDVLGRWAMKTPESSWRTVRFRFQTSPTHIDGSDDVEAVSVHSRLSGTETVHAQAVISAIGFRGAEIRGVPIDGAAARVANDGGRVRGVRGMYVVGWAKRGPRGVMGTNKQCARETVDAIVEDIAAGVVGRGAPGAAALGAVLAQLPVVDKAGWHRIDNAEVAAGQANACERLKLGTRDTLLLAAAAGATAPVA